MFWLFVSLFFFLESFGASLSEHDPKGAACDLKKSYTYYRICYSNEHRQSLWTVHLLTLNSVQGSTHRTNDYRKDYDLEDGVGSKDYRYSGYDRGHLVPAADMKLNHTSMSETFYMTNMSPQNSRFNSGIWRSLEGHIRKLVKTLGEAWVVTAPVISANDPAIASGVTVPGHFYKVIYFEKSDLMLAFMIPNTSEKGKTIFDYQYSVDEIESFTGLDFFSSLDDDLEDNLEKAH